MYFQVQKCSEHKTIFKMLPQSIYWKRLLCQHLFAFLGGQGEQWFYLPQAYSPVQVEKQIPQSTTVLTQGMENSITRPFIFRVGRQTTGEKMNSFSKQSLEAFWVQGWFPKHGGYSG